MAPASTARWHTEQATPIGVDASISTIGWPLTISWHRVSAQSLSANSKSIAILLFRPGLSLVTLDPNI